MNPIAIFVVVITLSLITLIVAHSKESYACDPTSACSDSDTCCNTPSGWVCCKPGQTCCPGGGCLDSGNICCGSGYCPSSQNCINGNCVDKPPCTKNTDCQNTTVANQTSICLGGKCVGVPADCDRSSCPTGTDCRSWDYYDKPGMLPIHYNKCLQGDQCGYNDPNYGC